MVPYGIDAQGMLTDFKQTERTGEIVCTHRGIFGKVYAVVKVDGGFEEIPLKKLKPFYTSYELKTEPSFVDG